MMVNFNISDNNAQKGHLIFKRFKNLEWGFIYITEGQS